MSSASKKQGTRVFKKGSPNGKITVYLGKRDFVDHVTHVDPIDGVVLVDPEYLKVTRLALHSEPHHLALRDAKNFRKSIC